QFSESDMNLFQSVSPSHDNVFGRSLSLDDIRRRAPAVFAGAAHERTSGTYTFIPSERVLSGLMQAGFVPVEARQTRARRSIDHARHVIRVRRRFETIQLRDSVPEVVFLNSHDGTSAYQLRVGLYRAVCANGLIVSVGGFPSIRVAHRGDIVEAVVSGALEMTERFEVLAAQVERMEARILDGGEQIRFAERAMLLRYPELAQRGMPASRLLTTRRPEDADASVWTVLNCVQENLLQGGLIRRSISGRLMRTRRITSIREDVRINSRLWDLATEVLAA
ncbi:MAG TPA: DUF932 domain-containing protein, partial [Steroidobacteraceae bacterium]